MTTQFCTVLWIFLVCLLSTKEHVVAEEEADLDSDPNSGHPHLTMEQRKVAAKIYNMHEKAHVLDEQGKYNESLALLEQIYPLERKILGSNHSQPFSTLLRIADRLISLNRVNDALAVYWKIYKFWEKVKGPNHLKTLQILHDLSRLYIHLGRPAKALGFLKTVYKHRRNNLGPEHLDTIDTLYEIANAMTKDSKGGDRSPYEEEKVLQYYNKVLEVQLRELGDWDRATLATLFNIGTYHLHHTKFQEAVEPLQAVVSMRQKLLGEDDPLTFQAKERLAHALVQLGRRKEAKALFKPKTEEEDQPKSKPGPGPSPEDQVQSLIIEGMTHMHHKRYEEALATFEGVIGSLPANHPDTLKVIKFLIFIHRSLSNFQKAITLARELVDLTRKNDPDNHRDIFEAWERIVEDYLRLKDREQMFRAIYELIEWAENNFIEGNEDPRLYKVLRIGASEKVSDKSLAEGLKLYEMLHKVILKMPEIREAELPKVSQLIQVIKVNIEGGNSEEEETKLEDSVEEAKQRKAKEHIEL